MRAFVDRHGLRHVPQAVDVDGALWHRFGVAAQPSWVFVDGDTGDVQRHVGALERDALEARLDELSGPGGP